MVTQSYAYIITWRLSTPDWSAPILNELIIQRYLISSLINIKMILFMNVIRVHDAATGNWFVP